MSKLTFSIGFRHDNSLLQQNFLFQQVLNLLNVADVVFVYMQIWRRRLIFFLLNLVKEFPFVRNILLTSCFKLLLVISPMLRVKFLV